MRAFRFRLLPLAGAARRCPEAGRAQTSISVQRAGALRRMDPSSRNSFPASTAAPTRFRRIRRQCGPGTPRSPMPVGPTLRPATWNPLTLGATDHSERAGAANWRFIHSVGPTPPTCSPFFPMPASTCSSGSNRWGAFRPGYRITTPLFLRAASAGRVIPDYLFEPMTWRSISIAPTCAEFCRRSCS